MELFLVYLWLKLPTIILITGLLFGTGLLLFVISKLAAKEVAVHDMSFNAWLDTEEAKKCGADIRYYHTARDMYDKCVPVQTKIIPPFVFPKWGLPATVLCGFLSFSSPNQTDAAILVGSAIALEMAKSPEGAKVGQLIRAKANELLDAELKKLQPQPAK